MARQESRTKPEAKQTWASTNREDVLWKQLEWACHAQKISISWKERYFVIIPNISFFGLN